MSSILQIQVILIYLNLNIQFKFYFTITWVVALLFGSSFLQMNTYVICNILNNFYVVLQTLLALFHIISNIILYSNNSSTVNSFELILSPFTLQHHKNFLFILNFSMLLFLHYDIFCSYVLLVLLFGMDGYWILFVYDRFHRSVTSRIYQVIYECDRIFTNLVPGKFTLTIFSYLYFYCI